MVLLMYPNEGISNLLQSNGNKNNNKWSAFIQPVSQSVCSSFTLPKECEEYSASFRIKLILFLARLHVLAGNATNGSADTQKGTNEISTLPFMMTSYLERVERRGRW